MFTSHHETGTNGQMMHLGLVWEKLEESALQVPKKAFQALSAWQFYIPFILKQQTSDKHEEYLPNP